jgi:calcium-dependent protein kinase
MGNVVQRSPAGGAQPTAPVNEPQPTAPAAAPAETEGAKKSETGEGLFVFDDPERRSRKLTDHYDVPEKEIGRGHYGVVRKGVRRADGARVAVKTIPKRRAVYIEMLRGEISLLQALDHPNIIRLYDAFEDEKQVHLVSEICEGGELFEPIADTSFRFSERQASRLVRRMLYAIKACHDKGIAHRDLKPENMLLTAPGIDSELKARDGGRL